MTGATITVPSQIDKLDMKAYLAEDDWCYQDGRVTTQPRFSEISSTASVEHGLGSFDRSLPVRLM